jgi:hypothetical protein
MKIRAEAKGWDEEITRSTNANRLIKESARRNVRVVSLNTKQRIMILMPVDTGAARARWGSPGAPGGIWRELDGGLTIEQGAALEPYEYIEKLNEGSSTQAPAGFIDVQLVQAEQELDNALLRDLLAIL